MEKPHSLSFERDVLTLKGITQVVEVSPKLALFKISNGSVTVKGEGINIAKLDKADGTVILETKRLDSITYKQGMGGIKGLFK